MRICSACHARSRDCVKCTDFCEEGYSCGECGESKLTLECSAQLKYSTPSIFNPTIPQIILRVEPPLVVGQPAQVRYDVGGIPLLDAIEIVQAAQTGMLQEFHAMLKQMSVVAQAQPGVIDPRRN